MHWCHRTVLDPGGYGMVTIGKVISIVNDGTGSATIMVRAGETGITVNAGASDEITLHGGDGAEHGHVPNALIARMCRDRDSAEKIGAT